MSDKDKIIQEIKQALEAWTRKYGKELLEGKVNSKAAAGIFEEIGILLKKYGRPELADTLEKRKRIGFKIVEDLNKIDKLNERIQLIDQMLRDEFR